ncbi:hypothetical protein R1flu_014085 [Riccia fluitans]|uniref:HIT-type domain-containing protein n=1 Tax=Riccia fluitans TaxID=41844 RepID=A0ABD1YG78_9MARC
MDDELSTPAARRSSTRVKKVGAKVSSVLTDPNVRAQAALARLDALESDHNAVETVDLDDDDEASLDDEEQGFREKKAAKGTKRKTRRAKAQAMERIGNSKKTPKTFLELLHEANLESLPPHLPSYLRAAVGPPSSGARRHFCTVCGYLASYTCTLCGARFCSCRCKVVHNDTRCQKFIQ